MGSEKMRDCYYEEEYLLEDTIVIGRQKKAEMRRQVVMMGEEVGERGIAIAIDYLIWVKRRRRRYLIWQYCGC